MDALVRMREEQSTGTLAALLDIAKQDLSQMDDIANDDLGPVQFNGREFLREAIEAVEGLLWALSCRNQLTFAAMFRAIAERWTVWKETVVDSDDPIGEIEKAALFPEKRLRHIAVKHPEYKQAVRERDAYVLARTGQKLDTVKIKNPTVGSPTDETDTMDYAIMSAVIHANFALDKVVLRFDVKPQIWARGACDSAIFFWALHDHIVLTLLGEQTTPRTGQWVNPNRWVDPHSQDG